MSGRTQFDIPLLIIGLLLTATLTAFLAGVFPYPFGLFILGFALLGRILQLQSRK
ncbi:MAG: hypothetical protein WBO73_18485 [Gammaproteobacteria bacterium]